MAEDRLRLAITLTLQEVGAYRGCGGLEGELRDGKLERVFQMSVARCQDCMALGELLDGILLPLPLSCLLVLDTLQMQLPPEVAISG